MLKQIYFMYVREKRETDKYTDQHAEMERLRQRVGKRLRQEKRKICDVKNGAEDRKVSRYELS